ncbi:MAG TPA: amino acid adenylation domain-containing protein, partial [Streptosporangiaceae bacterium]|nr:amino acid adenylation domain-containing protein [Streptosporangiaceae bacterium]
AAFGVVLCRHAGQDEVLIGTPVAFRPRSDFERSIGCFLNTVIMRVDTTGEVSAVQLLHRVRDMALSAFDHQQAPFDRLAAELATDHDLSRNPLYQVLFALQNVPEASLVVPGLQIETLPATEAHAQCDLSLRFTERGGELTGLIDYDLDLFREDTIDRLTGHLLAVLDQISSDPGGGRLSLLSPAERDQVVLAWNDTAVPYPLERTLPELIAEQARTSPQAPAVRFDGDELSYAELGARAGALAARLREAGVGPDVVVGVHLRRSAELVIALLAVLQAGGAYLPLEPDQPAGRLRAMVRASRAPVVLTSQDTTGLGTGGVEIIVTDTRGTDGLDGAPAAAGPELPAGPGNLAYVIYTSGSTGVPKGVQVPHRAIVNRLLWMQDAYRLGPADRVLHKTPVSFDVSVWELFWPLVSGACLVVAAPGRHRDPEYLTELVASQGVTVCHFVPVMLRALLDVPAAADLTSLRLVVCSGEELPADLAAQFLATFNARLENLYGPTEAAVDVTSWTCSPGAVARVPIGAPIANTRALVLDPALDPAPIGVPGELYLGGECLARGYQGRAALTAERFVADPHGPAGARLYRTGDRVRWLPDGQLEFLGRLDRQVKVRGFRIEPAEVERALEAHDSVGQALVVLREDRPGDRRLVAYLVGEPVPAAELATFAGTALPRYMVPSAFVWVDAFPVTASGKLDRAALPAPAHDRAPSRAPASAGERELAEVLADVLGVPRVGADDDFFELGGDSMHAIALVGRARARGFDLSVESVFRTPTVSALAQHRRAGPPPDQDQPAPAGAGAFALMSEEDRARLRGA